jgi:hypothetical protein
VEVWQGLKTESGDIADLTPRARQDPPVLRTTPFQEGEDDEDIGTPGRPTIRNIKSKVMPINKRYQRPTCLVWAEPIMGRFVSCSSRTMLFPGRPSI